MSSSSEKRAGELLKETPKEKRGAQTRDYFIEHDIFSWEPEKESDESDHKWENCTTNPEHKHFYSIEKLQISDLPAKWQDKGDKLIELIKTMAELTVRLRVLKASPFRPDWGPYSSDVRHFGTGFIYRVKPTAQPCPCVLRRPHKSWTYYISTARHVVFDSMEAGETLADLFFNNNVDVLQKNSGVVTLRGMKCYDLSDEEEDHGEDVGDSDDGDDSDDDENDPDYEVEEDQEDDEDDEEEEEDFRVIDEEDTGESNRDSQELEEKESSEEIEEEESQGKDNIGNEVLMKKVDIMTEDREEIAEHKDVGRIKEEYEAAELAGKEETKKQERDSDNELGKNEGDKPEEGNQNRLDKRKRSDERGGENYNLEMKKLRAIEPMPERQVKREMVKMDSEEEREYEGVSDERKEEMFQNVMKVKEEVIESEENERHYQTNEIECGRVREEEEDTRDMILGAADKDKEGEKDQEREEEGVVEGEEEEFSEGNDETEKEAGEDATNEEKEDVTWDVVKFTCVNHVENRFDKIRERLDNLDKLRKELGPWIQQLDSEPIIFISHPHGKPKLVTWGDLIDDGIKEVADDADDELDASYFYYTTPTCKGSSGAFALRWGTLKDRGSYDGITHCDGSRNKNNRGFLTLLD